MHEEPEEDEAGAAWERVIAEAWADDLADPRQDVYTRDEGTPCRRPSARPDRLTRALDSTAGVPRHQSISRRGFEPVLPQGSV